MEKAFKEKKCISSKFELARFHQVTDDIIIVLPCDHDSPTLCFKWGIFSHSVESTAPMRRVGENSPLETQCRAIMITR